MYSRIKLAKGKYALIDSEDSYVNAFAWKTGNERYAVRTLYNEQGEILGAERMHRLIMGIEDPDIVIDHINGDGLDNRKSNLRVCSQNENMKNHKLRSKKNSLTSQYKGVSVHTTNKTYIAQISVAKEKIYLGTFYTEEDAADAYDKASQKYHHEFGFNNKTELDIVENWSLYPELPRALVKKTHRQIQVWCSNGKIYSSIQEAAKDLNVKENSIVKACTMNRLRRVKGYLLKYTGIKIPVIKQYDYLRK